METQSHRCIGDSDGHSGKEKTEEAEKKLAKERRGMGEQKKKRTGERGEKRRGRRKERRYSLGWLLTDE